jgi:hypothetical protein
MNDPMREAFEKWARNQYYRVEWVENANRFRDMDVDDAWGGWQACANSRPAVTVPTAEEIRDAMNNAEQNMENVAKAIHALLTQMAGL